MKPITGLKVDAGGGPGSRGGKVIGTTSGGKPIYASVHPTHSSFSSKEHTEAANALKEYHDKTFSIAEKKTGTAKKVRELKNWHGAQAKEKKESATAAGQRIKARQAKRGKRTPLRFNRKGELISASGEKRNPKGLDKPI